MAMMCTKKKKCKKAHGACEHELQVIYVMGAVVLVLVMADAVAMF